ncbi:hypothetical protein FHG87_002372 [Trinorchestia longiramus]|nr:hypothetical protein FHG87_002372 [Trinorchestia longiramus]
MTSDDKISSVRNAGSNTEHTPYPHFVYTHTDFSSASRPRAAQGYLLSTRPRKTGHTGWSSVSQSGPYRPPGGVEEMQGGGRRVRFEWGAYITV